MLPGGVPLADGSVVAKNIERHSHPTAEELRWQVTEAGVEQAKGRLRDLRRKESCWVDILNDVVLPGPVNEAVEEKGCQAERGSGHGGRGCYPDEQPAC